MDRKHISLACCCIFLFIFCFSTYVQADSPNVQLNGNSISWGENPVFEKNKVLVPIRPLANVLNCSISFDEVTKIVTMQKDDNSIKFDIVQKTANQNDKDISADVPIKIINNTLFVPLRYVAENYNAAVSYNAENKTANIITGEDPTLQTIQTETELDSILTAYANQPNYPGVYQALESKDSAAVTPAAGAASRYSETNVQVEGIDEADIVKTDGKYIYQIRGDLVTISEAYPVNEMKVLQSVAFDDNNFTPNELYVDKNHLVVLGTTYKSRPSNEKITYSELPNESSPTLEPTISVMPDIYIPPLRRDMSLSKIIIYDITDKSQIHYERDIEVEGNYISSRKVGNYVYYVTNKSIDFNNGDVRPLYKDSAEEQELKAIDYGQIHYFPGYISPNFISVIALDLDGIGMQAQLETYLGYSDNIYMSDKSLYIAQSPDYNETAVFKFSIDKDNIKYVNKGIVKGRILNQFSMDEFDDSFRIATTNWNNSSNNIFVLDDQMKIIGKLSGLAPNERIYSVRFMGTRLYLVTFEQTDPFFVIDLSDKTNPKVLGELIIPGFSNYLHPLDENHMLGIGRDTSLVDENNFKRVIQGGIKLAIFDVSDLAKPVQESIKIIGDSGTSSEALYNHKAILFDKESNLLALPVNSYEYKGQPYSEMSEKQSVYVFNVNVESGISEKGQIFHSDDYYTQNNLIKRSLFIDDILYTVSNRKIKANLISNLQELGVLELE